MDIVQPNGTSDVLKPANGSALCSGSAPALPAVTTNMLPLATLLQNFAEYAFSEISYLVATLPNLQQPDSIKKKKLLELFVRLRKDLVKLYVLVKWSARARDFQRLIQLMSFMRTEQGNLFNSVWGMKSIVPGLASAKLPNPDLMTALEVFINGRPQLPSHNLIRQSALSAKTILKTFRNLNVLLAIKLALADDLPPRFRNYQIRDGRVTFTVDREFVASVSIADDETQDETISPFFLIDFRFLFGFPDDRYVLDDALVTPLPAPSHVKLESLANAVLHRSGLPGLYTILHHYATTYKLYLVHKQLANMRQSGVWKGHLQHTYNIDQSTIVVTYWAARAALRSFLEIGLNRKFELSFRWSKDGEYVSTHSLTEGLTDTDFGLNIEQTLTEITNKHAELALRGIYQQMSAQLAVRDGPALIRMLSPGKLHYQLTHTQHTVVSIDSITGNVFLVNPTPLMVSFVTRINKDAAAVAKVAYNLIVMRLEILTLKISSVLSAVGWIRNDVVKVSSGSEDWAKLQFSASSALNVQFFRRREWPQGWFLICGVNGYSSNLHWRVAQLRAALGAWQIQWLAKINLLAETDVLCEPKNYKSYFDYETLAELAVVAANKITSHLVLEELKAQGCRLMSLRTPTLAADPAVHNLLRADKSESVIVIDKDSLTAVPGCYSTLFLKIKLAGRFLCLSLYGKLRARINLKIDGPLAIKFEPETGVFEIQTQVETLSMGSAASGTLLAETLGKLTTLLNLISILNVLQQSRVEILLTDLDSIRFRYDSEEATLCGLVGAGIRLELAPNNPHNLVAVQLDSILATHGIPTLIKALGGTLPLVKALREISTANQEALRDAASGEFLLPKIRFSLFTRELNHFQLQYAAYLAESSAAVMDPHDIHSGTATLRALEVIDLTVRLRRGYRGRTYLFVTSPAPFLREFWSFKTNPFQEGDEPMDVHPLETGVACAVSCASRVLGVLNREILARGGVP
ncbi:hypothetical protein BABINDRAFT_161370 [Babjeviella inositovora NRRL Y-12698]|uniref:Mediator of RNA polymerase II transcription subunit 14 n=1 Tax=Babjeviella inositovora NRRL Y-12698 TaxID=984486 RepID=A0A1E3QRY8_9ASCO|nr:uncharacterized protein BABINDRAFT_161370 [Babjeviella inositovora NRRL Y-12698]ODQ80430.1 hypothetical protein BABINDRAFT_161370 [Babjeviella inositovora NRRL Y-12698]